MNIYDKRLASFRQKRRPSAAAGGKLVPTKWPHEQPSAKKLAEAGFFFNYTEGHPDNVTCYLCAKDLDGWEKDDDPSVEHFKHCPDCGWARVSVTQTVDDDRKHAEDPRGEIMMEARLDTFGRSQVWWPHEDKEGWIPKVEKMANAGWHYAPTKESDDFAICAYCELSLDGWEATDDPLEEHQRRSSSCVFFNWKPNAVKRPTRRASRASMQSVLGGSDDESTLKTTRKAPRAKKAKGPDQEHESISEGAPRGRKRPSTAAQQGPVIIYDGSKDTDEEAECEGQPPAQKKRATRASLAKPSISNHDRDLLKDNNPHASLASIAPAASKAGGKQMPKAKKAAARRASRVRGTSVSRKPAKQPALLSDDEIDRALALDLDRPLTDEEGGFKDFKKPFIRPMKRLTRSRASLAVEEKMRDAPPDSILNSTRVGRSRTPATEGERSPTKKFFRESSQDYSMPVRVPKHLAIEEDLGKKGWGKGLNRKVQEGGAERIINKGIARESTDINEIESKPLKNAPAKKAVRGKKVSEATAITEDEPEPQKPKRGRAAMKKTLAAGGANFSVEIEPEVEQEEEKPKGRKRLVKGANLKRDSVVSATSTAFSVKKPVAEPEPVPGPEPEQSFMDVEPAEVDVEDVPEVSDEGSIIHYDIHSQHPVLAPSPDHIAEPQEAETEKTPVEVEPTPERPKRTKKISTSNTLEKEKKTTRCSVLSISSTTASITADPNINSGEESDVSHHSSINVKNGRKVVKKASKKQLLARKAKVAGAMGDALKKGSESFFNSGQGKEMRKGRWENGKKIGGSVAGSTRGSFATESGGSSTRGSFTGGGTVRRSSVRGSFADKMSVADSSVCGSFAERSSMGDGSSVRASFVEERESFTSGRGPFAEPSSLGSSLRNSFVSDSENIQVVEVSAEVERGGRRSEPKATSASRIRVVSFADDNYPHLPTNTDQDELSTTDADVDPEEEDRIKSPINIAPSLARIPLSPVRRAVNVPLASTPKSYTKALSTLASRKPWTAVDLDMVFANLNAGGEEGNPGEVELSNREKEMTVAEWVKWNAAQAEFRMTGEAERVIGVFEREGRRAVEAVEGADTVD